MNEQSQQNAEMGDDEEAPPTDIVSAPGLPVFSAEQAVQQCEPCPVLCSGRGGTVVMKGLTVLVGAPGSLKTIGSLGMCSAVTSGVACCGWELDDAFRDSVRR